MLKTPGQWEAERGVKIPNRHVYHEVGLETPIDYETFRRITDTLTMMWGKERAPLTLAKDEVIETIEAKIVAFEERMVGEDWDEAAHAYRDGLEDARVAVEEMYKGGW